MPLLVNVSEFISPPGLLPGGKAIRRKSIDITPHASGVREYVPGDSIKRIHWPTSIRRDQLMVKEFEQDPQAEVWLFLDTYKMAHMAKPREDVEAPPVDDLFLLKRRKLKLHPSTLEYSITVAASLAHYFLGQRRSVGLVSASGRTHKVIPAERSEGRRPRSEGWPTCKPARTPAPLVAAQMGQLPQGSSAILIAHHLPGLLLCGWPPAPALRPVVVDDAAILWGAHHQ
jgi:hypothetical protein